MIEIRALKPDDYEQLIQLLMEFFVYAGNDILDDEETSRLWDKAIDEEKNYHMMCAIDHGELVGIVSVTFGESSYKAAPFAWCDDLYVKKAYRGHGIAKMLMERICDFSARVGCSNVLLGVGIDDEHAKELYKSLGFIEMRNTLLTLRTEL
ncbi:MAG: GNAT family N-acetyltransferase [Candidatus Eisenbacteria bacterium]|uniref:GNAT family N-acetyltransferase n=1 Tax=Eiseniibacteriota bacterium TaxID=2212470 RepID=A0A948RY66_UNCEI|nr:GNAT family N-acetyltransferase [Candidatus Eisenbacteria bacterium]MBU1950636.1 GNAT family N-acetyltransferase [Candidatus Eisenbacteria bacterium]MBU2691742.1 GNAT family N-acetyltransferase [Candidatus Eisenbacteria bacterium]